MFYIFLYYTKVGKVAKNVYSKGSSYLNFISSHNKLQQTCMLRRVGSL